VSEHDAKGWNGINPQLIVRGGRIRAIDAESGAVLDAELEAQLLELVQFTKKERIAFIEKHQPKQTL